MPLEVSLKQKHLFQIKKMNCLNTCRMVEASCKIFQPLWRQNQPNRQVWLHPLYFWIRFLRSGSNIILYYLYPCFVLIKLLKNQTLACQQVFHHRSNNLYNYKISSFLNRVVSTFSELPSVNLFSYYIKLRQWKILRK